MKLILKYHSLIMLLAAALFISQSMQAQIYSNSADAVKELSYTSLPDTDPLFVFYQSNGSYHPGVLKADGPAAGNFDFTWTKYDPDANAFSIAVSSESNVASSTISGLDEGGYEVRITNGTDTDTSFRAWLMLDNLIVWTLQDANGHVPIYQSGCPDDGGRYLYLSGGASLDTFYYYDPLTHETIMFENDFYVKWTTDNENFVVPGSWNKNALGSSATYSPPVKDTWYVLSVTDSLGMTEIDSVFFDTPFTNAKFSVEYYDKVSYEWDSTLTSSWGEDKGSLDAPLEVRFINRSVNGAEFTWVMLDTLDRTTNEYITEVEYTTDIDYQPTFTYYTADEYYYPYLISVSDAISPCSDTFELEEAIFVAPSQLAIPNVFTPNDDGDNDVFKFKHQSLESCKLTIIDRRGRVVYKQKIDDIYTWEGWRGTVLNSDMQAPEGQYYYVVEAMGYDNVEYKDLTWLEQKKLNIELGGGLGGGGGSTDPGGSGEAATETIYTGWLYLYRGIGEY